MSHLEGVTVVDRGGLAVFLAEDAVAEAAAAVGPVVRAASYCVGELSGCVADRALGCF